MKGTLGINWLPLWVIPLLVLMAIGTVWLRLTIVRTTYEINQTAGMIKNAERDLERIDLAVAVQRSPSHLEQLNQKKFHLSPPLAKQIIQMRDK